MKIAIFIQNPPWIVKAGYETSAFTMAKGLKRLGNDVDLICLRRGRGNEEETVDGIRVIYAGTKLRTGFAPLDTLLDSITQFFTSHRGIRKKYDIYYYFKGPLLPLIKKDVPIAFHSWGKPLYWEYWWSPIAIITNAIDFFTAERSDKIFAASPYIASEYKKFRMFREKTTTLNPGIDTSSFRHINNTSRIRTQLGLRKNEGAIVFVGRITTNKKVDELLEIFKTINEANHNLKLVVIGKGPDYYVNYLKRYAQRLGISSEVVFAGTLEHSKMPELFSTAKLNLFPSHRDTFGLVNIESQACGTPAIAYDIEGVRDSIKDGKTGFLVKFRNKELFAKRAVEILNNKREYKNMSKNARAWVVKEFDIDKLSLTVHNLLKRMSDAK